ncbi:MAG: STAS domain-containing protein [Flavobacteriales bacterium]|jgi:anti-anti-sigma factor|nr:STAS domain-containing protein [Flavobacteriales bacterium]
MNFTVSQNKDTAVINTKVEKLNASNAPELKAELTVLSNKSINNIIIDMKETKYCDSSGLSALLVANRMCKDTNGQFILCGLEKNVSKMIEIAQLHRVLTIVKSSKEALELVD